MERLRSLARPAAARQGPAAAVLLLAAIAAAPAASAAPRSPFAAWLGDVASPSAAAVRPLLGRRLETGLPDGSWIDVGRPLGAALDRSVPLIRADAAHHAGLGGRGVLIAIIDGGVDWTHPAFLDAGGGTRIRWYLDMTMSSRGGSAGPDDLGFALFSADDLNRAFADPTAPRPSGDPSGHGTHVASVAAGSAAPYRGVAPEAALVVVRADRLPGGRFDEADVADALRFAFAAADLEGRPCVANVSLGGSLGAHDGSSVLERAIDALTVGGPSGRAIVVSAGNEGLSGLHAVLDPIDGSPQATLVVPRNAPIPGTARAVVLLDFWSAPGRRFDLRVQTPGGETLDTGELGPTVERDLGGGAAIRVEAGVDPRPDTGRFETLVALVGEDAGPVPSGSWAFEARGDGAVHAWVSLETAASTFPFRFAGDVRREGSISIPATADGAIAVGAMVGRTGWRNDLGEWLEDPAIRSGTIAAFSAVGPTLDGRLKPDLLAPGVWVISAHAAGVELPLGPSGRTATGTDPMFSASSGTSLAAPHVAGALALLFERDPDLSASEALDRLRVTASADGSWSADGGFGLIDVAAGLDAPGDAGDGAELVVSASSAILDGHEDRRLEIAAAVRTDAGSAASARRVEWTASDGLALTERSAGLVSTVVVDASGLGDRGCGTLTARLPGLAEDRIRLCVGSTEAPAGCAAAGPAPSRSFPVLIFAMLAAVTTARIASRPTRRPRIGESTRWWPFALASLGINAAVAPLVAFVLPDDAARIARMPLAVALLDVERPQPPVEVAVEAPRPEPTVAPSPPGLVVATPEPTVRAASPRRARAASIAQPAPPVAGADEVVVAAAIPAGGPAEALLPAEESTIPADVAPAAIEATVAAPVAGAPAADPCSEAGAAVRSRIDAAKSYPPLARRRAVTGVSVVSFRVDGSGAVSAATIAQSSGSALLDDAAVEAVRSAAPYPEGGCDYAVPVRFRIE